MRLSQASVMWLVAAGLVLGLAGSALAVPLPLEEGFESFAVGAYPSADGWITLLAGKSGSVVGIPAHSGSKSFRLDSWPWSARTDYLRLDRVPDCVGYEASLYLDPTKGRSAEVGFVAGWGNPGPMWNYFRVDGSTGRVRFFGVAWTDLGPYVPGTWCTVRADLDFQDLKADLWVNGVMVAEQVDIWPKAFYHASLGTVSLSQWGVNSPSPSFSDRYWGNLVYFDDLKLWEWSNVIEVQVDIKPGTYPNPVNLGANGLLPVAIFSAQNFDATQIDPSTVEVAGAPVAVKGRGRYMAHEQDVDGDGLMDLLVQVQTREIDRSQLEGGYAVVTGLTESGEEFVGQDEVVLVPR